MVYVAFVIDVFARKIVGWRVSTSMTTGFVLDALNQAICQRCPKNGSGLVHHLNRGSQYLSIKYTERLAEAGIDPSVGSVGDSYDNAMAETIIGLFKTEVINFIGPWKSVGQIEWETMAWVSWYNSERLHSAIGYVPPGTAIKTSCRALAMSIATKTGVFCVIVIMVIVDLLCCVVCAKPL
jgi:putative transposase